MPPRRPVRPARRRGRGPRAALAPGLALGALAAAAAGCSPPPGDAPAGPPAPYFLEATIETGLAFVHVNGAAGALYMPEIMGAGAGLLDYDGDGDLDVYLVQGARIGPAAAGGPPPSSDRLFRNELAETGTLGFTDVTADSGLDATGQGMGVATGDFDNDGDVDLYVTNFGPNQLWRNEGDGTFADVTDAAGAGDDRWSVPAAFVDVDADGWLDLFIGNYVDFRVANHKDCFSGTGVSDYCGPHSYGPVPDRLLRNRGDGTFEDVTAAAGLRAAYGKALGVVTADFDLDGHMDIYVANDGVVNQLWMNRGDGTFREDALLAGCALNAEGQAESSMGVDAVDFDGDGDEDLFMTHLKSETNTLYVNLGGGVFEDRSVRMGVAAASLPLTGFGTAFLDLENDGLLDLLVVNGAVALEEELAQAGDPHPYRQRDQLFRNVGGADGPRFEDVTAVAGPPFEHVEVGRGAAFGDVDDDGDTDVVVTNNRGPARLLLNARGQDGAWLGVRALEREGGRDALGALVLLTAPDGRRHVRRVRTAGSYASASDPRLLFGLGSREAAGADARVTVCWPGGACETWDAVPTGRHTSLVRGAGTPGDAAP